MTLLDLCRRTPPKPNLRKGVRRAGSPSPRPPRFCWQSRSASAGAISILFLMLFKKLYWSDEWILRFGRDFPWTVPVSHAVLLLIPGMVIAMISRLRPRLFSMRGVVAVRDARDLGGLAQAAAVRRLHPFPGRRAGSADRRRGREPWLVRADGAMYPGGAPRRAGCPGGSVVGSAGDPGTASRWPDCRHHPRVARTSC